MSMALLALSLCTFALGFAEFVAVSLVPSIATSMHLSVGSVGAMIGIYAIGVSIGAPTLSAILARAPRTAVLALSMFVFAAGNIVTAMSASVVLLLVSRFVSGLMHGVVIALAASTAASAVGPEKSGSAIATVFGGLTVALVLGVPLGTFAGSHFHWQDAFIAIALIGVASGVALLLFAPRPSPIERAASARSGVRPSVRATVLNLKLLHPVATTAFTYTASFTGFTYISVLLQHVTGMGAEGVTAMFVLYGISAALGNAMAGGFVDRFGSRFATLCVLAGLFLALFGAYAGGSSVAAMAVVMIVWGLASFGAVPVLQKTVLSVARSDSAASQEVASGMNIAAFNIGIALGSMLGGAASLYGAAVPMLVGIAPLAIATALAFRFVGAARNPPLGGIGQRS